VRELLARHVDSGFVPGVVAVLARHGEVHIQATGNLAFEGAGSTTPMAGDTICRMGSMSKPIVAACAMTLVEDCTLRLDDPVDDLLPELADMTVLADPNGPLEDTVAAKRPITLRDLLTYTLGTGMVPAEPGTVPIADALDTLGQPPPDEWIRRLGTLPLIHQPGERWMYDTAADVTGVLIARATGMSFGDALRERICDPLGMKDTAFSVGHGSIGRLATAYERDNAATGEPVVDDGPDGRWSRPPAFESGGGGLVSTADDLPRLRLGAARGWHPPWGAGALAAVGDADDKRPPDPGAEGGLRVLAGVLRHHGLGFRDVGPHPPHAPRPLGRELRMARLLRHRLVQRSRRGHDDDLHHAASARRRPEAAEVARLLDRRLPGDRRLTRGPETAKSGGGVHTRRPQTGPVTYSFEGVLPVGGRDLPTMTTSRTLMPAIRARMD
jgi:CubicO group peptidase (beta-lactamase class C family)